jgi:hypothetical protein
VDAAVSGMEVTVVEAVEPHAPLHSLGGYAAPPPRATSFSTSLVTNASDYGAWDGDLRCASFVNRANQVEEYVYKLYDGSVAGPDTYISVFDVSMMLSQCYRGDILSPYQHSMALKKGKSAISTKLENWNEWDQKGDTAIFRRAMVPLAQAKFVLKARIDAFLCEFPGNFLSPSQNEPAFYSLAIYRMVLNKLQMCDLMGDYEMNMQTRDGAMTSFLHAQFERPSFKAKQIVGV